MQHDMPRRAAKKLQSGTRARTSPTSRAFSAHKHKPQCKFTVSAEIERRLCYLIGWRETCATCVRHLSIEIKKQESNLCQYLVQFHALPMCTGVRPRVCTFSHALCVVAQKGQPRQGGLGSPAPQAAAWATCSASARGPAATRAVAAADCPRAFLAPTHSHKHEEVVYSRESCRVVRCPMLSYHITSHAIT